MSQLMKVIQVSNPNCLSAFPNSTLGSPLFFSLQPKSEINLVIAHSLSFRYLSIQSFHLNNPQPLWDSMQRMLTDSWCKAQNFLKVNFDHQVKVIRIKEFLLFAFFFNLISVHSTHFIHNFLIAFNNAKSALKIHTVAKQKENGSN